MKLYVVVTFIAAVLLISIVVIAIIEQVKKAEFETNKLEIDVDEVLEENEQLRKENERLRNEFIDFTLKMSSCLIKTPISNEQTVERKKCANNSETPTETTFCFGEEKNGDS